MAQDNTGISLSVSDPDNNNEPQQWGDGGAADAEDYCTAELLHGDELAGLLNIAGGSGPIPRRGQSGDGSTGGRRSRSKHMRGVAGYLALGGIVIAVFVGISILNRG
jgi:hypothetical protein